MGDFVLFNQCDDGIRVHVAQNDGRATDVLASSCPSATTDVKQRHGNKVDHAVIEFPEVACTRKHAEEVGVREHDTLWTTSSST